MSNREKERRDLEEMREWIDSLERISRILPPEIHQNHLNNFFAVRRYLERTLVVTERIYAEKYGEDEKP